MADRATSGESEQRRRAGDYILGRMSETERERAERDLEIDAAFRDAVIALAEDMHIFGRAETPASPSPERWQAIVARIADLPQMRQADLSGIDPEKPVIGTAKRTVGMGLHALPNRRAIIVALGLIAAFALGYLAGRL
jgi:anti-sigma-K factor RskA